MSTIRNAAQSSRLWLEARGRLPTQDPRGCFELGYIAAWVQWQRRERERHAEDQRQILRDVDAMMEAEPAIVDLPLLPPGWVDPG